MNKVSINGRLIKDPELKIFNNNIPLCTFYIANNSFLGIKKKTGFFKCQAWGKQGRIIAKSATAGTEMVIVGRLNQRKYEDKNGNTIYEVSIIVEEFNFGGKLLTRSSNMLKAAS